MPTEAPTWDQTRALDTEPTWDSTQPTWENTREASPVESPRAARKADLQAQQAQAREEGVTTSIPTRLAAGIEQGMNTPERMIRGGLDALQYYRTLDAASQLAGGNGGFEQENLAWLKAFNERDAQLARETAAIEGRDRNFAGDLVQGVARGVVELPPQLLAGAAGAARGVATAASAAIGGAQGGLTQFSQDRGEGMAQAEALPYAAANAGITFLTTAAFGNSGVESIFRKEGVQGFRRRLAGVLKDAGMEGAEEMADQVQQDLLERMARNPGKSLDATLYDVLQAGAVGTAIGGVASAPRLLNRQSAIGNRQSLDGPAYVVNSETGTTEFGPVDELPAPLELTPVELPEAVLSEAAPTFNSPATSPMTAAPAATAEAATPGLSLEPIEFSPFDTGGSDPEARTREREDSRTEWQDPLAPKPAPLILWAASTPTDNVPVQGVWDVVDAAQLRTSFDADYDQSLQPRDRTRQASSNQIARLAQGFEPQRAGESATTDMGAPIVDERNQVLSGNGRVSALRTLYGAENVEQAVGEKERSENYRLWLVQNADRWGVDPSRIRGLSNPVLVRRVTNFNNLTKQEFARQSNQQQVLGQSEAEQAGSDARMLAENQNLFDALTPNAEGDVLAASNREFLNGFIQGVGGAAELLTKEGSYTPALKRRVQNAVLGALVGPENRTLLGSLIERGDELGVKTQVNALIALAPRLARLRGTPFQLGDVMERALADLVRFKSGTETLTDFLSQQSLLGDESRTADTDRLFRFLAEAKSAKEIGEALDRYVRASQNAIADAQSGGMFGSAPATRGEVIQSIYGRQAQSSSTQGGLTLGESPPPRYGGEAAQQPAQPADTGVLPGAPAGAAAQEEVANALPSPQPEAAAGNLPGREQPADSPGRQPDNPRKPRRQRAGADRRTPQQRLADAREGIGNQLEFLQLRQEQLAWVNNPAYAAEASKNPTTIAARNELRKVEGQIEILQRIVNGSPEEQIAWLEKLTEDMAPPVRDAVANVIAAIESAKIKPGGIYSLPDLGLTVTLWNGALNAAQLSLRAGQRLAEAIQSGLDWLRAQGQQFDEAKVRAALEQAILQSPGVREHVGKRLLQEDFSPAAKAAVEKLLLHEVKPDEQLFAEAAAVIEAVGPREALASYFGNPWGLPQDSHVVLGFALGNALSALETQARATGDTATANRIGQENAEFQSQFVLQSTETARTLRAYRYFDLVGNLSPFTADVFARKVIEKANAQERNRLKPTLDTVGTELDKVNQQAVNEAAGDKGVQGTARTVINQTIEAEAEKADSAVRKAIVLEVSNTLETLPSVVRKASEAVVQAWRKLGLEEQVRVQTGRAGQALENSLWSAVKQRGGAASTVASVIAQVNRALHEQVNRTLGVTKEQFTNPATYLMRLRDALGNAEVMSRIWEQTRAAVGANLRAIGEMEGLLLRIEAEIADLEAQAKLPLVGGPEVTATDPKLKAQQQGARDAMLAGRNANLAEAIKQRRERLVDVTAQLEEFRKMKPAWDAVLGMTVDVWGANLLRGVLREQMKADGFRLRKAVADHFRGLAGAPDPLATLGTLTKKIIAASGLDEQAAGRLAKDFEAEYTAQVEKERARLAERLAKTRERQAARAKQRAADQPRLDAEALIDGYERRQTEWLKPPGRKSAVRAIVRQALRQGAAVAGLDEQAVRGGLRSHLEAVGVPTEAAYRLAYEVWQARQAAGGGLDAVVAGRVKALQLNLGAIVRKHWSQVGRAGESLAEQIVGETGMPAEQAERLAAAIERRFKALATAKKEALLRNLAKTPAARQLQKKSVSQRIIEFSNLGAFDSEGLWNAVAEKLGLASYSREASTEVKRLAEKAQQLPEGSVQRQEATARLMRFIARQHGLKLGELGWAFWYANTLSGPLTQVVNILSNSLSLAGNVATQFRDGRGIPQILAATAKGFRTGAQEARAILRQGPGANRTKFVEQGQALENLDPQDFTGAGLVRQWRIVARALAAADAAFYFPAREAKAITLARALARQEGKTGAAIRQRAREILDGTEQQQNVWGAQVDRERAQLVALGERPDALWTARRLEQLREQAWDSAIGEAADDFALRVTYNNQPYGLIGALADVAKTAQRRVPLARAVVPFVNIVANVTNDSINYTPWGFARAYAGAQTGVPSVTALWADKLRDGQTPLTPDAVLDLQAKAALGTALVGGIMAAALANLDDDDGENFQLYGQGPKDAAARKAWKETGAIPYSVRVNGKYISIANTPLAIPLGAMGNYLDAARWDKRFDEADMFNRFGVALWGGAHVITQQSFLDSAARLAGAIENPRGRSDTLGDRGLAEALRSGGSLVVPNALRQLDRMFDPTLYDNRGIEGALVASIPFARRNGSPALNAFGEPITSSPWSRFASDAKPNVWADLAHRGVYPSTAEKVKNRWGREMTDDEHYRYVELSGQAIKRRLDTPGMRQQIRTGKEDDLRKALTGIVKDEREKARTKLGF